MRNTPKPQIRDDGTLDTVVSCPLCGEEQRYTFDGTEGGSYADFREWALEDFASEHECPDPDEHDHEAEGCRYLGNDAWDCGKIDNLPFSEGDDE